MKARVLGAALLVGAVALSVGSGCAARRQRKAEQKALLGAEVLYERAMQEFSRKNLRKAQQYLQRIQYTAENRPDLEPLVRLALADVTFFQGDDLSLIDARSKYLDFVTLYGDHPKAPYAQLQAGVCSLRQAGHPSRDQTQTLVALSDLREVERKYPASTYLTAARDMIALGETNLAEHDYVVGRFYFRRKAYLAAAERFREILDRYPHFRDKEKVYYDLGRALVLGNNDAEGKIYLDKLVSDYPDSELAGEARKFLSEVSGGGKASLEKG